MVAGIDQTRWDVIQTTGQACHVSLQLHMEHVLQENEPHVQQQNCIFHDEEKHNCCMLFKLQQFPVNILYHNHRLKLNFDFAIIFFLLYFIAMAICYGLVYCS